MKIVFLVATICVATVIPVCLREGVVVHAQAAQAATPAAPAPSAQTPPANQGSAPAGPPIVFKSQSKLVLVDSIVTDKKGNYIRDLTQKDFRIWEDNKEQEVKSFSYESASTSPSDRTTHYMVLFFDNSTMEFADQARARNAAGKFIDANARPNRLIALVDFGGTLRITQNFTADADRLKKVVAGVKFSAVSPNPQSPVEVASLGAPPLAGAEANFAARTMLLAIRELAKNLMAVPGRKSLVVLTAGFPLTPEQQSELTATIDACNKANVAVYPIDVRGLVAPISTTGRRAHFTPAVFHYSGNAEPTPHLLLVQHGGAGGGAGGGGGHPGGGGGGGGTGGAGGGGGGGHSGGSGGGSSGGGHSGGGAGGGGGHSGGGAGGRPVSGTGAGGTRGYTPMNYYGQNPNFQPRTIVPPFPESTASNQQVLYVLADGTGGFVIHDTNDLLNGMERIGKEQDEYYTIGYAPTDSPEGSCHTIKVKVDRGGTVIRSRSGYCKTKPVDLLAGKPIERELESHAASSQPGAVTGSLAAPFFFTSPNIARVNLAMEVPATAIKFEKQKGKFRADVNVLGIASKPDGTEAARFSDTVHLEFEKKELEEFNQKPFRYENQFDVASGSYTLKVVFSSGGESFGKLEAPLAIDSYDGKHFLVSGLALSKEVHPVSELAEGLDADLVAGYVPLVTAGVEVVPAADYHFKKTDFAAVYFEIYEPLLMGSNPPKVGVDYKVVDAKTGEARIHSGVPNTDSAIRTGNPVVPLGLKIPVDQLAPGSYRLELRALDSAGNSSPVRAAEFAVN